MSDLVTITVDGVEVSVPKGTLVVDAAKRIGNDIPVFCYHPKMSPVGMCRMCLVEVGMPMRDRATGELMMNEDGSPKINFGRGLQTGCTVQVGPGMVVRTNTAVVTEARESIIEFLLSSHPLDCPICDKGGECPLQNLTLAHGKGNSRVVYSDKKKMDKHVPLGDLIFLDRERCIQCARCVRFQEEVVGDPVIRFHNRGRSLEIATFSDPGFDSYWSGNTTDICPVGALTTADFRFGARPWEMTPVATISPHGPAGSNMTFSTRIEAAAGGRSVIKRVMPRQHELVNETWISDRDRFVHHFADAPDRLTKPLLRKDGELVAVSWDEALNFVAEKLQGAGTAVAGLSGDRVSNEDLFLFQNLFRKGLKSGNIDLANRRLAGGDVAAQVGIVNETAYDNPQRLGAGDAILVVASDLHEEEPIWWLRVKQAAERGATVVVLNVRPTRLDESAKFAIQYVPGTAVATVRQLLNSAKVEVESSDNELIAAAQALVKAQNLVVFYGAEGVTYAETEAIARMLGNLLLVKNGGEGHVGRVNNGLIPVWPHNNTQGAWDMGVHPALEPGYKAAKAAGLDAAAIYAGASSGDIKALYVMGADPVGDGLMANRGQLDLLVVQELFLTETAKLADVVLPAQSWAEREGTFTSGERRVQRYYPAIPAVGESRPDWQILAQVGERVGMGKPAFAASLVFRDIVRAMKAYKGMDYRTLAQVEKQWPDVGGDDLYYGGNAYENRSGLGQQWTITPPKEAFAVLDVPETAVTGLTLVRAAALYTPGTLNRCSSVLAPRLAQPTVLLHATDAAALKLADGDRATVELNGAAVQAAVHVNGATPAGVAVIRGVAYQPGTAVAHISKLAE
ncbi:MAG: NADH-quinone oxidoreductase subunit NuoG [Ardenticatenaceae bacterium]|nr:NADH-quinone oxidoreductase subunit NuoG [Ardenticatenaceae bacterium]MCB8989763.1 NADH-quinone oxidoreductase subunit NuoG [Ardenticatenaceae bacterium]MCB9002778.1 NADH-quinone oxidoreductase subunit NuoG [Ardenticatenaceae bacterium]